MSISITVDGVSYPVPSSAADTNWAADQVALEQALATGVNTALDASENAVRRLSVNTTQVGTGADTTEDNLMTYTLPANTLSANGKGVRVTAFGTGVSTADVTTLRSYFGAGAVSDYVLTASQGNIWRLTFDILRTGAATQVSSSLLTISPFSGGTNTTVHQIGGPAETMSGAIVIKLTGQRASTSSANSIVQLAMVVELIP